MIDKPESELIDGKMSDTTASGTTLTALVTPEPEPKPKPKSKSNGTNGVKASETPPAELAASEPENSPAPPVQKPKTSFLDKYKSKNMSTTAEVPPALMALTVQKIADVGDYVWVHPDEDNYWTGELCFVDVPVKGEKKRTILHVIDDDIAAANKIPAKQIRRMRLALAAKPDGSFFFCIVPSRNLDNSFNHTALDAIEKCRSGWGKASSRKAQGYDDYEYTPARHKDFAPEPKWPSAPLDELAEITFRGVNIDTDNHPGLLRLLGAKQDLK